jgi:integrase
MRRVLQRANGKLGTNWTLHDLRHTAATRMIRR